MLLPEVTTLATPAARRINAAGGPALAAMAPPSRRAALFALGRFVRIPLICAAMVALATPNGAGRLIALGIALLVVAAGVTLHARTLFAPLARR